MESIKDKVAIVGMGCSKFGERWDTSAEDLLVESCYEAFADAGIESKDIQAAWFGTTRLGTGQPLAHAIKLEYVPITRVENACATATDAMINACNAVAAKVYDIVLVAGVEKLKDSGVGHLGTGGGAPSSEITPATPPPAQFALAANRYFHQYGISLLKGYGLAVGGQQGMLRDYYDFTHFDETVTAGKMAYTQAGIKNPREEVSMAEVHDCFSITELIIYEDMGWSARGKAKDDIEAGFFNLDGGLPVNTDGGLKCFGHPIGASGVRMIYEMYKQLQGKAGKRQLKNPRYGVTHNLGGRPGSFTCAVSIWGSRD